MIVEKMRGNKIKIFYFFNCVTNEKKKTYLNNINILNNYPKKINILNKNGML